MTSNPGDEKVIQDDIRFKGETSHNRFGIIGEQVSGRVGNNVYYDPSNPGPYVDGKDALDDVPVGGTFIISAGSDYDVATEGRLVFDMPMTVRGEGWYADPDRNISGSKVVNTGSDAVDNSLIRYSADTRDQRGAVVRDLAIVHEGSSSPAIHISNSIRSLVADCKINMDLVGQTGILFDESSFFARVYRTHVERFTKYGIRTTGSGGGDSIVDCHSGSGSSGAIATRIEREGFRISGGQHSADSVGISCYNPTDVTMRGGHIDGDIWFEHCDTGIEVDGDTNRFDHVNIVTPRAMLDPNGSGVQDLVKIGNSADTKVLWPILFRSANSGNLATLGSNALRPMFVGDYNVGIASVVDNGATKPLKFIPARQTDSNLTNYDTTIPVYVALRDAASGSWSPAFNDGTDWYEQSSANTTFTP